MGLGSNIGATCTGQKNAALSTRNNKGLSRRLNEIDASRVLRFEQRLDACRRVRLLLLPVPHVPHLEAARRALLRPDVRPGQRRRAAHQAQAHARHPGEAATALRDNEVLSVWSRLCGLFQLPLSRTLGFSVKITFIVCLQGSACNDCLIFCCCCCQCAACQMQREMDTAGWPQS